MSDFNYKITLDNICIMLPKHDFYSQWEDIFWYKFKCDLKQEIIKINKL